MKNSHFNRTSLYSKQNSNMRLISVVSTVKKFRLYGMVTFHLMSVLKKSIPNIRSPSKCVFNPKVLPVHLLLWVDKLQENINVNAKGMWRLTDMNPDF